MANENSLDILVRFMLDEAANARVKAGVSSINDELKKIGATVSKETEKGFDGVDKKIKETEQAAKRTYATLLAEAKALSAEAAVITNNLKQAQIQALRGVAGQIEGISKLSLATGTGLLGGILGFANKYVREAETATETTIAWKKAQDELNRSGQRFGAVLAQEALPLLRQAAAFSSKVAEFVENNPEAVRAALNTGKVLIGLGAIGLLVSKGIKLTADIKYLATIPAQLQAAALQDIAADKQLLAAQTRLKELGGLLPTASKAAPAAGSLGGAALLVAAPVMGAIIADRIFDALEGRDQKFGDYITTIKQAAAVSAFNFTNLIAGQQKALKAFELVATALGLRNSQNTSSPSFDDSASSAFTPLLKAYEKYKNEDLKLLEDHYKEREKITQGALDAEKKAAASHSRDIRKINESEKKSLASESKRFADNERQAERQYRDERASIIRDGGQEIQRIEADLQERLRTLRIESGEREQTLIAARDALGLAKERRSLINAENEATRSANLEIRQRRADLAQRLEDAAVAFQREREQRFADYQAKLEEIRANAEEERSVRREQYRDEINEIRAQKNASLKELSEKLTEERRRKFQAALADIRELDTSLLAERTLRKKYQDFMISDLDKFFAQYRGKMQQLPQRPAGFADGGYASGIVQTGERGVEWIASHSTTRAAEQIVGGRLTQENVLAAMMGRGGQVVWNDNRRFDGAYTNEIRRENRKDTLAILSRAMKD